MSDIIKTIKYKGYTIEIHQDEDAESPREWDNLGNMVCFHRRYNLGDKHNYKSSNFNNWDDFKKTLIEDEGAYIILPLYLYDHGGITMRTTEFSCHWDSGMVGLIYAKREDILKEYNCKKISKKTKNLVTFLLISEVKIYDEYLRGNCYGYVITDKNGESLDSCWGFIGEVDYPIKEAKGIVDYDIIQEEKKKWEKFSKNQMQFEFV